MLHIRVSVVVCSAIKGHSNILQNYGCLYQFSFDKQAELIKIKLPVFCVRVAG